MQYMYQFIVAVQAVLLLGSCHGFPLLPTAMYIGLTNQSNVVDIFLEYLTDNANVSLVTQDPNGSCPWKYVIQDDTNRFPVSIIQAELTIEDNRCLNAPNGFDVDYFCEYVYKSATVLTKQCPFCPYTNEAINVRVGTTCVSTNS